MTEQQIRESYVKLYRKVLTVQQHTEFIRSDKQKCYDLKHLRDEAEQLGLRDWTQLIEARMLSLNNQYDAAIDKSISILSCDSLTSELRAWILLNRGYAYNNLEPSKTKDAITDYTAIIEMRDATAEQRVLAFLNRGVAYGKFSPPRIDDSISDYTTVIKMLDVPTEHKVWAHINRGGAYGTLSPPKINDEISDYTTVINMSDAAVEQKAIALINRGFVYTDIEPPRTEDAIADYVTIIGMNDAPAERRTQAFLNRANVYCTSNPPRIDDAISDYTAVVNMRDAPTEQKVSALINRGVAHEKSSPPKINDAMSDYTVVIKMRDATEDKKAIAFFNRGIVHRKLEPPNIEAAIADYTAIIEMSDVSTKHKALALVNRGNAFDVINPPRTDDAILDYTAVIEMKDISVAQKAAAFHGRGFVCCKAGKLNDGKADLLKAMEAYRQIGDQWHIKSVDFLLSRIDVPKEDLSQEDKEIIEAVSTTSSGNEPVSIEKKIINIFATTKTTVYKKYSERESHIYIKDNAAKNEVILAILKGWGSAVPLVLGGEGACRGGGYFLKFNGKGLAVDPGFDYLKNFHDQKFHLRELDAVLVSHNHPDHTHDLKSIDNVKYETWPYLKNTTSPYSLVLDIDTDRTAEEWTKNSKGFRKAPILADFNRHDIIDLHKEAGLPFAVKPFKVEHSEDVPHAVGYRVSCMNKKKEVLSVGFSCDTQYFTDLSNKKNLGGCDVLVAHMSQPSIAELEDPKKAKFKKGHLGYRGTVELIKQCKPKLTIVSEFWAGLDDTRILLLQGLRKRCGTDNILPGGVGLLIKAVGESKRFEILCTNCKNWTPHEEIKVGSSSAAFGPLNYLCPDCCL